MTDERKVTMFKYGRKIEFTYEPKYPPHLPPPGPSNIICMTPNPLPCPTTNEELQRQGESISYRLFQRFVRWAMRLDRYAK